MTKIARLSLWLCLAALLSSPTTAVCPEDAQGSLYHCDNPLLILPDPAIRCNAETCLWELNFIPNEKPAPCEALRFVEREIDNLPDLLEPCLWYEMRYGKLDYLLPEETESPTETPSQPPSIAPSNVGKCRRFIAARHCLHYFPIVDFCFFEASQPSP